MKNKFFIIFSISALFFSISGPVFAATIPVVGPDNPNGDQPRIADFNNWSVDVTDDNITTPIQGQFCIVFNNNSSDPIIAGTDCAEVNYGEANIFYIPKSVPLTDPAPYDPNHPFDEGAVYDYTAEGYFIPDGETEPVYFANGTHFKIYNYNAPEPTTSAMFSVGPSLIDKIKANVSGQITDEGTLGWIAISGGLILFFYIMQQLIKILAKRNNNDKK